MFCAAIVFHSISLLTMYVMVYLVSEMVENLEIDYHDIVRKTFYKGRHVLVSYKFSQTLSCSDENNPCKTHPQDESHLWIQKELWNK